MTDKAFSDLTSASALNDADIFAITQSGTSKKIASSVVKTYMQEGFTPTSTTTLTNKTVDLTNNTLTGTIAQFNSALSDADFCTIAGSETITNKTLTTPILSATVSGTTSGKLGYLSGALSYGDGTNQQTVATLDRTQTFTAAQSFSDNVTLGDASGDTVTFNAGTVTLNNNTTITAASTKSITLNGGAGSNGLVINASNNVGIGAASSGGKFEVASVGAGVVLKQNATGAATYYVFDNTVETGGKRWRLGYTGAAGTSVGQFAIYNQTDSTLGWVLDASGNLGLGVTPSAWTSGYSAIQLSTSGAAIFGRTAANTIYVGSNTYRSASGFNYVTSTAATLYEGENGVHYWYNAPSGTAGNAITFTQAMTLEASGNLLVGKTVADDIAQSGVVLYGNTGIVSATFDTAISKNTYHLYNKNATNNGYRFYVNSNGGIYNFSANNSNLSDERVKTAITPAPSWLAKVNAIEVVNFKYKDQAHDDFNLGVIAQQVLEVAPEIINEEGFGETPEDGKPLLSIYETDLMYGMLKAIQELSAELNELKQRIK